jgi:hypothetical protein
MKFVSVLSKHRFMFVVLSVLLAVLVAGGAVLAAVSSVTIKNTGSVVQSGGSPGGTPVATYTFTITGAGITGDTLDWGSVNVGSYIEKTVTITRTGNTTVTVTPDLTTAPSGVATLVATPASVTLTNNNATTMILRLTGVAAGSLAFDTVFNGTP